MKKIKVLICVGTRPEIIKMGPVYNELKQRLQSFEVSVYHSGQHHELANDALKAFPMEIDYQGNAMKSGQLISETYSRILSESGEVISKLLPDIVLVQGDTITAFACGISAFLGKTRVGHVEAGLRSSNILSPWPEELNRILLDRFADYLFTPTLEATNRLNAENPPGIVTYTGNTGIDAVLQIASSLNFVKPIDRKRGKENSPRILVTQHRRENIGRPLSKIISAINLLSESGFEIIFPIHANPEVRIAIERQLVIRHNVHLIPALEYTEMIKLLSTIDLIITDSGGLQEEGPALGIPVIVTRDSTERPEGLHSGSSLLVGVETETIETTARKLLAFTSEYESMARANCPYGEGNASKLIVNFLEDQLHSEE